MELPAQTETLFKDLSEFSMTPATKYAYQQLSWGPTGYTKGYFFNHILDYTFIFYQLTLLHDYSFHSLPLCISRLQYLISGSRNLSSARSCVDLGTVTKPNREGCINCREVEAEVIELTVSMNEEGETLHCRIQAWID